MITRRVDQPLSLRLSSPFRLYLPPSCRAFVLCLSHCSRATSLSLSRPPRSFLSFPASASFSFTFIVSCFLCHLLLLSRLFHLFRSYRNRSTLLRYFLASSIVCVFFIHPTVSIYLPFFLSRFSFPLFVAVYFFLPLRLSSYDVSSLFFSMLSPAAFSPFLRSALAGVDLISPRLCVCAISYRSIVFPHHSLTLRVTGSQ